MLIARLNGALLVLLAFWAPLPAQDAAPTQLQTEYQPLLVTRVAAGLEHPWSIAFLPDGNLLVTERPGRLQRLDTGSAREVTGVPAVHAHGQGGLLDVTLHPAFSENQLVYLSYSEGTAEETVLAVGRGRLEGERLDGFEVIFRTNRGATPGGHYGGRLLFLDDGTLLVSVGDRGAEPDRAQDPADHAGTVLRLTDAGGTPEDNPFVGRAGYAAEVYTYGHRNIQGLAVDRRTGRIWATEHGPRGGDELNLLQPGGNYGWPAVSLGRNYPNQRASAPARTSAGMRDPVLGFMPTLAPSGLTYVDAQGYHQAWRGNLLAGGLRSERVLRIVLEGDEVVHMEEVVNGEFGRIRDLRQGPDGAIWVVTDATDGSVYRLAPPPRNEAGLLARFASVDGLSRWLELVEEAGLLQPFDAGGPFTIFAPSDEAFAALPQGTLEGLLRDPQRILALIAAHTVPGEHSLESLMATGEATTLSGDRLPINRQESVFRVSNAMIVRPDIGAANGVIHTIDRVLIEVNG